MKEKIRRRKKMIEQSFLGSQGLGPLYSGVVAFYLTDGLK
jgi:hypothetical protein